RYQGISTYRPIPEIKMATKALKGNCIRELSHEESQEEEPLTESRDPTPGQEREEDQGAAEIQVSDLEADLQELSQSKTGNECRDDPDVKGKILPKLEHFKMPEAGTLSIK
ncbi:hypothetical protein H8957_017689, partial [Semnopithecus entellus]